MKRTYTPELDASIRESILAGLSLRQVGKKLNISHNAIGGRAQRLGIKSPNPPPTFLPKENNKVPGRHLPRYAASDGAIQGDTLGALKLLDQSPEWTDHVIYEEWRGKLTKYLVDTARTMGIGADFNGTVHNCQFPLWDKRATSGKFCDEPTIEGKAYCPHHYKIAYEVTAES
jgi:GcrA cell cycle regulator